MPMFLWYMSKLALAYKCSQYREVFHMNAIGLNEIYNSILLRNDHPYHEPFLKRKSMTLILSSM
jgi:hypothetical protein